MQRYDAELRDWAILRVSGFSTVIGYIYADGKSRFPDGRLVRTSPLIKAKSAREGSVVETLNSRYLLVGPRRTLQELLDTSRLPDDRVIDIS